VGLSGLRLALAFAFALTPQEAYSFFWSRHLALSYFDHPPAIALLVRGFTELLGQHELTLRLCAFTQTLVLQWAFWQLARRYLPGARLWDGVLLFCSTGAVTLLSLISLPDVPLLLFWTLAVLQLHRAIFERRRAAWIWAGLFMGLAFDGKYTGLLLQVGLVGFLLLSRRYRALFATPWPYLTLLLAHVVMSPVYLWNAQHHFASFLFQSRDRLHGGFQPTWRYLAALFATQSTLFGPVLLLALFAAFSKLRLDRPRRLFLAAFSLPLFVLCWSISLGALVKPNWMLPCYVTGSLLVAQLLSTRWVKVSLGFSAVLHALAALELVLYPVPIRSTDTWVGWPELGARVTLLLEQHPDAFLFAADEYKTSAELLFYQSRKAYGPNVLGQRGLHFDHVDTDLTPLLHGSALYVLSAPRDTTPGRSGTIPPALLEHFATCQEEDPLVRWRWGRVERKFLFYSCSDYRGPGSRGP
jgi:4-amino-4-deoxy-L-arabinose transferase-like glycosyltransferase